MYINFSTYHEWQNIPRMVKYRTKPSQNQSLSWNKKLRQQQNQFFLVQILRDLSNLKDQKKKEWFSIMKTSDQSKKTWRFWQQRERIKRVENSSNRVSKKKYFFLCFCQSSSKHELNSYTQFKRGIHRLQHVESKNE